MLLTAFDRRPLGGSQPDRTATPSYRQGSRQLMESRGAPRDPVVDALADHRAGFVARVDGASSRSLASAALRLFLAGWSLSMSISATCSRSRKNPGDVGAVMGAGDIERRKLLRTLISSEAWVFRFNWTLLDTPWGGSE